MGKGSFINDPQYYELQIEKLSKELTECCKFINGKLYAYNPETHRYDKEVSMGFPSLNYSEPLKTFAAAPFTYTAEKDCYLIGVLNPVGTAAGKIAINGLDIAGVPYETSGSNRGHQQMFKLTEGDEVVLNGVQKNLFVLAEK